MQRTYISETPNLIGQKVKLSGWVDVRRDHGKIIFIDLRDKSGLVQLVFLAGDKELWTQAEKLRPEWVISIEGQVNERPEKMRNPDIITGGVEVLVESLEILSEAKTLPFEINNSGYELNEEVRMKYRYLDLRRERLQKNLKMRAQIVKFIRDFLTEKEFIEIETPVLTKSTPEGARDYLVPSRICPGKFYALPQSPQQYKQLCMVAGLERYFQIAKCFRDEDGRGDRQAEFTQLDLEMSFVEQEEILNLTEELYTKLVEKLLPGYHITQTPWPRLKYDDVMKEYGTDKPDLRKDKNNPKELSFAFVVDFPMFEKSEKTGQWSSAHHPFTMMKKSDLHYLDIGELDKIKADSYDFVLNGCEMASGSIRINDAKIQKKVFSALGLSDDEIETRFGHMLDAFTFGAPPHGGIAPGIDRFVMIVQNEPNIREVIAFPKTTDGRDLMMDSPSEVNGEQLKELHIKTSNIKN